MCDCQNNLCLVYSYPLDIIHSQDKDKFSSSDQQHKRFKKFKFNISLMVKLE